MLVTISSLPLVSSLAIILMLGVPKPNRITIYMLFARTMQKAVRSSSIVSIRTCTSTYTSHLLTLDVCVVELASRLVARVTK